MQFQGKLIFLKM